MLLRPVKSRVLEGGVGWTSAGRLERSRERLNLLEAEEEDLDGRGVKSILMSRCVCVCLMWQRLSSKQCGGADLGVMRLGMMVLQKD